MSLCIHSLVFNHFFLLLDIIGVIVDVNPIEERKVPGGKVDMLSIRLKDIRYRIYIYNTNATIMCCGMRSLVYDELIMRTNIKITVGT